MHRLHIQIGLMTTLLLAGPLSAAVQVEFNAATAGAGVDPSGVSPAWTRYGTAMTNNGTFLLQDNTGDDPNTQSGEYLSPTVPNLMKVGSGNYGVEFRVRPLTDVPFLGGGHYANCYVTWSDDTWNYNVTIDRFTNDSSGTGGIKYGKDSLSDAVTGIDWSVPHTIFIGYRSAGNLFDFYVDGVYRSTVGYGSIARVGSFARDAVDFGDGTTGQGIDVAAEWYFVRLHDVAFPAPPSGTTVISYDAAAAGAGVDPAGATPPWTRYGTAMTNNGTFLLQNNTADDPVTQSGEYLSPPAGGLMKYNASSYGIEFRIRPLTDVPFLGASHFANLYLTWSDNTWSYNVTIDKDTDDAGAGTTGGIKYGGNSLSDALTGIDWSTPHTIFIGYRGSANLFDFYLDDVYQKSIPAGSIARSGSFARDAVDFGDGTTGQGIDVAAEWYFVKVHTIDHPENVVIPSGLLVGFDASAAGAGVDPSGVSPPWQRFGTPMSNNGTFLLQDNTADDPFLQSGEYLSPLAAPGLMKLGDGQYGIEFKIRPLTDVPNLGLSHYANLYLTWSDDTYSYNVTVDKFTDDVSGTGGIRYGKDSMTNAVTGVDWSQPHTVYIGYRGSALPAGEFDIYIDRVLKATIGAGSIARTGSYARDSVGFGDGTTGQPAPHEIDVAAEWYFVRVYGSASLPPNPNPCGDTWADADEDLDVDMDDFGAFQACYTGPGGSRPAACVCFDRPEPGFPNGDGDVDVTDFTAFQNCASGATVPAVVGCGGS